MTGCFQERRQAENCGDQTEIENDRRRSRRRKPAKRVQHTAELRDKRDKQQVGKRDLRQLNGESEPVGVIGKSRRETIHDPGHRHLKRRDEKHQGDDQNRQDFLGKTARRIPPAFRHLPREQGHKSGIERAFGKQTAEEIRQLEGDEKCVGYRAGTQRGRNQNITREAQQPADHREAADRGDGTKQRHDLP